MRKPCYDHSQDKNKGAWSKQEDQKLADYIRVHGESCWRSIPRAAGLLRCGKSCRLRWINYLRPDLKRGNFGEDEEDLIIKLHALLGNRWSLIAGRLPGRTDNEVKNYWNSHLRRKLIKMGIDPNNHRSAHILHHQQQVLDQRASSESDNLVKHKYYNDHHQQCNDNYPHHNLGTHKVIDDQVSEAPNSSTCSDEEYSSSATLLPDLNLDLTMAISPFTRQHTQGQTRHLNFMESKVTTREIESCSSPTLLLFI
ncbi:hypothetical protein Sjap_024881 [Stephania japonica]|uniref:Uncharacterized protein n=1 Tax=Stephania japonica TaxID=461633 RepID=A0AAP0EMV1_9MAGN